MTFELIAQARTLQGTGASRRLRRAGTVPGIVYGGEAAPVAIETNHNDLLLKLKKEAFHSSIINIVVDGKKEQVLLRDYQMHAYRPLVLHIDFQRVDATHELHVKVPLHFVNEEIAPGVKLNGGLVNHVTTEVDIQCLAKDLPEFIEVDLSALNVGDSIHINQLKLPNGVKLGHHVVADSVVVGVVGKGGSSEAAEGEAAAAE
ncbi:MAG: 50S ribosomal protein L25/general stress protein Ctc [Gammaproteobacteria bacterium]|jgi:large subunit ribosomal protein L25|nr:50S ribosomal protein L25/general stress protein Ctc [Gammaproteobacteria bacterium]MBU1602422.1 50S ribosomal protein L25/general stress protein Ctc [Gammaproteobacteria bacterium]MBU2433227.1 50S ribosomal protein L25/general stress protein Ctc [Gammaproteobacteria bacterium]MBU2451143.1 50S ribosomal protein L25/general stress protein Ctc [Gammaproteobacteria bacterium]